MLDEKRRHVVESTANYLFAMTVWLVNPFYNTPLEGLRPERYWLMAEAFARAGHDVTYWTSDFSHAMKRKRVVVAPGCGTPSIEVRMVPTLPYPRNICLARVRSHMRLASDWLAASRRCGQVPGLVVASMPPLGLCGSAMKFAKECGALFVADVNDAWPETFERILPRPLLWPMRRAARRIYRGADGICAVSRRYLDLAASYGSKAPSFLATHCIDMAGRPAARKERRNDALRLVYAGNMGLSYDLKTLVEAVAKTDGATLDLAGNGPDRPALEALVQSSGLGDKVRFRGYMGAEELPQLLAECDIGVVPMFPESCVGVPGKIADYAKASLKVIESLGGEAGELVKAHGAGAHYEAGSADSLRDAIERVRRDLATPWDCDGFAAEFDARRIMDGLVTWTCRELGKKEQATKTQT